MRRRAGPRWWLVLGALAIPAGAVAQGAPDAGDADEAPAAARPGLDVADLDLDALLAQDIRTQKVTVASKREETVGDAPATLTVLTHEDFVRHDWRSVAEALRSVPGLVVSNGRDYFATGVRGLSFPGDVDTRILVLVDGHTMNNPWSAASNTGELLAVPPAAVERVEVIRGPASSVYGSNAFFAVVNIVTRRPTEAVPRRLAVEALASTAQAFRGTVAGQARASFGLEVWGFASAVSGEGPTVLYEDATRPGLNRALPTPSAGLTRGTDFEHGASAGLSLGFKGFSATAQLRNRWKGLPGAPGGAIFGDAYNGVVDQHVFAEAGWSGGLGAHRVSARAFADAFVTRRFLHRDPSDWEPGVWSHGDVRTVSEGNAVRAGGEVSATLALHARDTLVVGAEVASARISQPTWELDPATGQADPATVAGGLKDASGVVQPVLPLNVAGYLQNDWRPVDAVTFVVGARYDYNTVFFRADTPLSALAPRAAAVYRVLPELTLKASYGEAFRYPTVFEAFFDDQSSACGNSAVRPERQRTAELAAAWAFARGLNLSASAYWMQLQGLLVRQPIAECYVGSGPRQQYVNAGDVMVVGAEAGLDVRHAAVTAFFNVGLTHAQQSRGTVTARPANSPTAVVNGGLAVPVLAERVFASLRAHLVSERLAWTQVDRVPAALRVEGALTARRLFGGFTGGVSILTAFKLTEPDARFEEPAQRDPVSGGESTARAVPQNLVEVRAHVGYEL